MRKKAAAAMAAVTAMMLAGCAFSSIKTATQQDFNELMVGGGYCDPDDGLTTDSEDGSVQIMQANSGWLVGFYVCADDDVAENEFYGQCQEEGMEDFVDGRNFTSAEKHDDENYLYYVVADNTCLFMRGSADNETEMKQFVKELGYDTE